jgi:allantoin racemase
MRILCINPNTTVKMTEAVAAALQSFLPADTELVTHTGRFGAPYISTRTTFAIGAHAAIDAFCSVADQSWDAVALACFGDPAILALRDIAAVPVMGMAEASMRMAARQPGCFSIVTGGKAWEKMLPEFAAEIGLSDRLCSVRATIAAGGEIFQDQAGALDSLLDQIAQCRSDGAARVILGGAGLAGLADEIRPRSPLPVIDCVEALAILIGEAVAHDRARCLAARPSPVAAGLRGAGWI